MAKNKVKRIIRGQRPADQYSDRVIKLGKRIKELRKKQGYESALDFALDKDIYFSQLARWETGKNMTFESLCKLADAFEVSLADFLKEI